MNYPTPTVEHLLADLSEARRAAPGSRVIDIELIVRRLEEIRDHATTKEENTMTTTANLTRVRSVLDIPNDLGDRVAFSSRAKDGRAARRVRFSKEDYDEMGRPDKVTVTIEPGDRLNDGKAASTVTHAATAEKIRDSLIYTLDRAENHDFDVSGAEDIADEIIAQFKDDEIIVTGQEAFDGLILDKVYEALLVDLSRERARPGDAPDELRPPDTRTLTQKIHAATMTVVNEHLYGPTPPPPEHAVQAAVADALVQLGEMPHWWTRSDFHSAALRLHDALIVAGYRLVAESDADTVRRVRALAESWAEADDETVIDHGMTTLTVTNQLGRELLATLDGVR